MSDRSRQIVVIKVGGDVVAAPEQLSGMVQNVAELLEAGLAPVLLHGGGPQVNALQARLGLKANKVGGRRITSAADLLVVQQAICGEVNVALCAALQKGGVNAFGCHGASGRMIGAQKRPPRVVSGAGDTPIDFGEVGDVVDINTAPIEALLGANLVPVIATLGLDEQGRVFNINADTTVVKLAAALKAKALLMVTTIGGIFRDLADPESRLEKISEAQARTLITEGVIVGGMIPKVEEALTALRAGVGAICIVPPATQGAFLNATQQEGTIGTVIVP